MKRNLCGMLVLVLLSACTTTSEELRINGSTAVTTERGIAAMKRKLKQEDRLPFTAAIMTIQVSGLTNAVDLTDKEKLRTTDYGFVGKKIHGLTYQEILALAQQSPNKVTIKRVSRIYY